MEAEDRVREEAIGRALDAFVDRHYARCVEEASSILPKGTIHSLLALATSLQRLSAAEGIADLRTRFERLREPAPVMFAFLSMVLGDTFPDEAQKAPQTRSELAQFHCALGSKLLTDGRVDEARAHFASCIEIGEDEMMTLLAYRQSSWPSQKPVPRELGNELYSLLEEAQRADRGGRPNDALEITLNARKLLDASHCCGSAHRLMIHRNLVIMASKLGDIEGVRRAGEALLLEVQELGPGEAVDEFLFAAEDLAYVFGETKLHSLAVPLLLRAAGVRKRYVANDAALCLTVTRLAKASAEAGDAEGAATHLCNAMGFAEDHLTPAQIADPLLPLFLRVMALNVGPLHENETLCRLLAHLPPIAKADRFGLGKDLFVAALKLWPHAGAGQREQIVSCLRRTIVEGEEGGSSPGDLLRAFRRYGDISCEPQFIEAGRAIFDRFALPIGLEGKPLELLRVLVGVSAPFESVDATTEKVLALIKDGAVTGMSAGLREPTLVAVKELASVLEHHGQAHAALRLGAALPGSRLEHSAGEARPDADALIEEGARLAALQDFTNSRQVLFAAQHIIESDPNPDWRRLCRLYTALGSASIRHGGEETRSWHQRAFEAARAGGEKRDSRDMMTLAANLAQARMRLHEYDAADAEITTLLEGLDEAALDAVGLKRLRLAQADIAIARRDCGAASAIIDALRDVVSSREDPGFAFNLSLSARRAYAGSGRWREAVEMAVLGLEVTEQRTLQALRTLPDDKRFMLFQEFRGAQSTVLSTLASASASDLPPELVARVWAALQTRNTLSLDCLLAERRLKGDPAIELLVEELRRTDAALLAVQLTGSSKEARVDKAQEQKAIRVLRTLLGDEPLFFLTGKVRTQVIQELPREVSLPKGYDPKASELSARLERKRELLQRAIRASAVFGRAFEAIQRDRAPAEALLRDHPFDVLQVCAFDHQPPAEAPLETPAHVQIVAFYKGAGAAAPVFASSQLLALSASKQHEQTDPDLAPAFCDIVVKVLAASSKKMRPLVAILDGAFQGHSLGGVRDLDGVVLAGRREIGFAIKLSHALRAPPPEGRPTKRPRTLVVGNPAFSPASERKKAGRSRSADVLSFFETQDERARSGAVFSDLPGAELEGRLVGRLLRSPLLAGERASARNVMKAMPSNIVHLATHGFFIPSNNDDWRAVPLDPAMGVRSFSAPQGATLSVLSPRLANPLHRSGLALAGANPFLRTAKLNKKTGAGLLLAADIIGMDWSEVDLLVLSACETGLGAGRVGEGVIGLQQAMLAAGVRAFVISTWSIPDEVTCLLMQTFYRGLANEGLTIAQALSEAQREVREMTAGQFNTRARELNRKERARFAEIPPSRIAPDARPFQHESWWGGFRAVGDVWRPLKML